MMEVFLALGSNLGDRAANLEAAIAALAPDIAVRDRSPVYETDPKYVTDQPRFLNMVVHGETGLDAMALLHRLKEIEAALGRTPTIRFGPRVIDLDIVFYGDEVFETADLVIPHAALAERAFVLRPLADLAPAKCHPANGRTVREMLQALPPEDGLIPYRPDA